MYVYDYGNYLQNKTKLNDIAVETAKEVLSSNEPNKEEETKNGNQYFFLATLLLGIV